jgi:hypothetical protein
VATNINIAYGTIKDYIRTAVKERKLRGFENRMLRSIFGSNRVEVTGGWRNLMMRGFITYSSPTIVRMMKSIRMRWAGHVAIVEKRNACRMLVENPEGKRPLRRPRREWIILRSVLRR